MSPMCIWSGVVGCICIACAPASSTGLMLPVGAKLAHLAPRMFILTWSWSTCMSFCSIQFCGPALSGAVICPVSGLGICCCSSAVVVSPPSRKLMISSPTNTYFMLLLCCYYYLNVTNY